jgi:hypothetical protein
MKEYDPNDAIDFIFKKAPDYVFAQIGLWMNLK